MRDYMKEFIKNLPIIGSIVRTAKAYLVKMLFPGSLEYWENKYQKGGDSGPGSYGRLAIFKAEIINSFIEENNIKSIIEFGCGDGNQLSIGEYGVYIGLDVSKVAISSCMKRFNDDKTKSFLLYHPLYIIDNQKLLCAELALSLDVIYHLIEDDIYEKYLKQLFQSSNKFIIIYSSDYENNSGPPHVRHRNFSRFISANFPDWSLIRKIKNKYPYNKLSPENTSFCDFFIYKKVRN